MRTTLAPAARARGALLALLTAALAAGCATLGTGGPGSGPAVWETVPGDDEILVRVQNDLAPATTAQVSLLPATRPEEFLGTVQAGDRQAFLIETDLFTSSYFLLAEKSGGGHIVSREIDLLSRAVITWNLATNQIRVERPTN